MMKTSTFDDDSGMRSVGAGGQTSQYGYDLNENPTRSTTPKQDSTNSSYDALDRLVSSTDPLNGVTGLAYDGQDNLTRVTDPRGVVTQYQYDGLGNLTQLASPDSGTTTYTHDAAGNVVSKTDARGVVTTYSYDALNRLTGRQYPATPALNVQYHYDMTANGNKGIGRLTAVQDASGVLGYHYDDHGNLQQQIRSVEVAGSDKYDSLEYAYDGANQLARIAYPAGFAVEYQRNGAGQVSEVDIVIGNQAPAAFANGISYQPFGPLKTLTWANGISLARSYDQDYRLSQQNVGVWQATYGYDANSNIQSLQSNVFGDLAYSYDKLDRLTAEEQATQRQEYSYDAVGNRTSKTVTPIVDGQAQNSTTTSLSYASTSNRLTLLGDQPVTSDAAGNLTQDRTNRTLEYDAQGRLSKVTLGSTVVAEYRYNALGQRTHKITDTTTTTFLYGPDGQLLGENRYSAAGVKLSSQYYLWLDSMPLGGITLNFDAAGTISSSTVFYLHSDHLNTPRLATNQSQQEVWRWKSDAFGNGVAVSAQGSGLSAINLRFPGQYYDSESGRHYNYFRDYDPQTGRYVESDPIGLNGGLNTFGYVEANPLDSIDPLGLSRRRARSGTERPPGEPANTATATGIVREIQRYDSGFRYETVSSNGVRYTSRDIQRLQETLEGHQSSGVCPAPLNLSPYGAGRRGAFREAKRGESIPTSQQPSRVLPNTDLRGNPQPGRIYEYEVPSAGGTQTRRIRDDAAGHYYGQGNSQNRGSHFNDSANGHYDY